MKKRLIAAFFLFVGMVSSSGAQPPAQKLLRQKTQYRLQKIMDRSPAITGLVAVDLKKGERTFSFNPDIVFPQASAIKIPILMNIFKQAQEGKFKLSDKQTVTPAAVVGGTGVIKSLIGPVSFSVHNLSVLMMALSDNTATNVLIDLVGMANVNAMLKSLGLEKTILQRKMMNAEASANGQENVSTPGEAATILQMLYDGTFINKEISSDIISFLKKPARRDSRLATSLPDSVSIAFKPGELNGVSTEWAIILLPEHPYAVTVMESYKPGTKGRAIEEMSKILYQYFWRIGNATRYGTYANSVWN